jgi:hypothetical protein
VLSPGICCVTTILVSISVDGWWPEPENWSTAQSYSSVGTGGSVAGWGSVAQGGVSAAVVVVVFPVADDDAGLGQRPEASSMFSPSAGMQTVVPFSCSVVMCGLLPC